MSWLLSEMLEWVGASPVVNQSVDGVRISAVKPIHEASVGELSLLFSKEYLAVAAETSASVVLTSQDLYDALVKKGIKTKALFAIAPNANLASAVLSARCAQTVTPSLTLSSLKPGIHPSAVVHPSAVIHPQSEISAFCVVDEGAVIGAGTKLHPRVSIGSKVKVGEQCQLFSGVVIYENCVIGDEVRIHANTVIGSDGFGYVQTQSPHLKHHKLWHIGAVKIGNHVEIGASSTVDRGTWGDTIIGDQAKLDNQVHIGHNAKLDVGAVICGGTCLAGRASVGKFAFVGGLTGIDNAVHVGDGAKVGALSMITKDVEPGSVAAGNPQRELKEHFKIHAMLNRMIKGKQNG